MFDRYDITITINTKYKRHPPACTHMHMLVHVFFESINLDPIMKLEYHL